VSRDCAKEAALTVSHRDNLLPATPTTALIGVVADYLNLYKTCLRADKAQTVKFDVAVMTGPDVPE
jgi:hypothetical protein